MIIKQDFWYWPAEQNRTLHIYLPDDYQYSPERYPVMYFFDGHNLFYDQDATYGTCWGLKTFLDQWQKKCIVVGLECSHEGNERLNEYSPYRKRMFGHILEGRGKETMEWIVNDVKPYIDRTFRTYSHREATAIGGSSMGGLMSMYAVIVYNHVFSKAACVSTGVFWNLANFRRDLKRSHIDPDTRIYMSWGEIEAGHAAHHGDPEYDTREARSIRRFESELQERGVSTYLFFQRQGRHCEADWAKQVPVFMPFLWY